MPTKVAKYQIAYVYNKQDVYAEMFDIALAEKICKDWSKWIDNDNPVDLCVIDKETGIIQCVYSNGERDDELRCYECGRVLKYGHPKRCKAGKKKKVKKKVK